MPHFHVRGESAFDQPASLLVRFLAFFTDAVIALALLCVTFELFDFVTVLRWPWLLAIFCLYLAGNLLQQMLWGQTLGQRIWRLKLLIPNREVIGGASRLPGLSFRAWMKARTCQHERLNVALFLSGSFLTALVFLGGTWIAFKTVWQHPLLMQTDNWELNAYVPTQSESQDWSVLPYFYAIGAWPRVYNGHPVLYSLPYEKGGPPTHFVGHIISRWEMPDVRMTAEGPRTPIQASRDELRDCFRDSRIRCLKLREATLLRHIQEIREIKPKNWRIRWFTVNNPELPIDEQPQGVYLSGANKERAQERFILITPRGVHQAFVLDRPTNESGTIAQMYFVQAIRSQRITAGLDTGRAWVDRQLAQTQLGNLEAAVEASSFIPKLADIQGLLISKISVDPRTFDSFYHLGGTAMLLARQALRNKNADWSAIAKPLLQSSFRYAQDVAPADPRTRQLEDLWLEAKKF